MDAAGAWRVGRGSMEALGLLGSDRSGFIEWTYVPAVVLFPLVEVVKNLGVAPDALLAPLGVAERDVSEAGRRFPHETYIAMIERARALTGEPGLGYPWGLQMRRLHLRLLDSRR